MRTRLERAIKDESGKVFILVLALLVVGGLILGPVLGLMGTGLSAGQVYEKKTHELYAADAGVEDALWKLMNVYESLDWEVTPDPERHTYSYPPDGEQWIMNDKEVTVSIVRINEGEEVLSCGTNLTRYVFEIRSEATLDGSSTTVVSYVTATWSEPLEEDADNGDAGNGNGGGNGENGAQPYPGQGSVGSGTWIVEDGGTVNGNIEGTAVVYGEGDLTVTGNIEENAQVYVEGNLTLDGGNVENGVIICVGGDLTRNGKFENDVRVYVEGNLEASEGIEDGARVCVQGSITVRKIERSGKGTPTVCAGGDLTVTDKIDGGYIYVGGTITAPSGKNEPTSTGGFENCPLCSPSCPDCRICCECPLQPPGTPGGEVGNGGTGTGDNGQGSLGPLQVASYTINP